MHNSRRIRLAHLHCCCNYVTLELSMSLPVVPSESIEALPGYKYTEVFNLAKTDMDFFAGLALPEVYKYPFQI